MHIVCPHCTTSYAVDPANFSAAGRRVRCARCQEVWLAIPQELASTAAMSRPATDDYRPDEGFRPRRDTADDWQDSQAAHIESPSISPGRSEPDAGPVAAADQNWPSLAQQDVVEGGPGQSSRLKGVGGSVTPFFKPSNWAKALPGALTLPTACMALGAIVFALIAWRADVVRAMPQTAAFFKMIGMGVNLRGLAFEDLKISTETVNDKTVLLIEGALIDVARRSVEIPRLRFIVRDAKGADIYAWNAVLEQPVLNPGEKAWFKTRLASPPADGREIAVRFFHKLDIATGGT